MLRVVNPVHRRGDSSRPVCRDAGRFRGGGFRIDRDQPSLNRRPDRATEPDTYRRSNRGDSRQWNLPDCCCSRISFSSAPGAGRALPVNFPLCCKTPSAFVRISIPGVPLCRVAVRYQSSRCGFVCARAAGCPDRIGANGGTENGRERTRVEHGEYDRREIRHVSKRITPAAPRCGRGETRTEIFGRPGHSSMPRYAGRYPAWEQVICSLRRCGPPCGTAAWAIRPSVCRPCISRATLRH